MLKYTVKKFETSCSVDKFIDSCVNISQSREYCHTCRNFGNNWMCPPFVDFNVENIWKHVKKLKLYAWQLYFTQPAITPNEINVSTYAMDVFRFEEDKFLKQLLIYEKQTRGSICFSTGSCSLCKECARTKKKPCIHPDIARHSIESIGADARLAAKQLLNLELLWVENNRLPEYLTIIGMLLSR